MSNQFREGKSKTFLRRKKLRKIEEETLRPLQFLHEMYDKQLKIGRLKNDVIDQKVWRRDLCIVRAICKLIKPLLRFDNLLSFKHRVIIELMTSQSHTPDVFAALVPGMLALKRYVEGVFDCEKRNKRPLVWVDWNVSVDLALAFDVQPFCPEALGATAAMPTSAGFTERVIDVAEQAGIPPELCSSNKSAIGACLAGQLPEPVCIVTGSQPCDSVVSSCQLLEYLTGAPTFLLDIPYWEDERALEYCAVDIRRLIDFLEGHLDRRLDYDRLREVLTEVNRTNELLMELNEMHRATPCPGGIWSHMAGWFFRVMGIGTPEVTEMARRLHEVTRNRLEAGRGAIKKEKIRVIWFHLPIIFYPITIWMEETFGAVALIDLMSHVNQPPIDTSTPESMIRGLAQENMNLMMVQHFHGQIEIFERDLHRICEEYNGDCFIYSGQAGCKHSWATTRLLKEYMKKINMPLLILYTDIFDRRVTSEEQIKAQIEEFFVSNGMA